MNGSPKPPRQAVKPKKPRSRPIAKTRGRKAGGRAKPMLQGKTMHTASRLLATFLLLLGFAATEPALAQIQGSVQQQGSVTLNDCVAWVSNYVVKDGGIGCGSGGPTLVPGTTLISPKTNGGMLYDNNGILDDSTTLPSGLTIPSPTLTAPSLGAATATTINGVTIPSTTDTVALLGTAETFTAAQQFPAGSVSAPGAAVGASGTGLYSPAAGQLGIAVSGVVKIDYGITTASVVTVAPQLNSGTAMEAPEFIVQPATGPIFWNTRGELTSSAAGDVQLGAADTAGSPTAQTLSVQSASAVSNTAGALLKIEDSAGTGTGGSGGFELDTHPASGSSSTKNSPVLALGISSGGTFTLDTAIYASCTALTTNSGGVIGCTASDPRLKDIDPAPYSGGLNEILRITPITFRGKSGNEENVDTRHQAGFNCWNVRDSLPLATHQDSRGYCNLDPMAIDAALINAIKEQQKQIQRLEERGR